MPNFFIVLTVCLPLFLLASCSKEKELSPQSDLLIESQEQLTITMGGDANYYPYTYLEVANYPKSRSYPKGFDVRIMNEIAKEIDVDIKFALGTWKDIIADLERGKIDIVPMFITPDRNKYIFAKPHKHRHYVLFGYKDLDYISSINETSGKTILVQAETAGHRWLLEHAKSSNIVAIDDILDLYDQIQSNSDLYVFNEETQFRSFLKKKGLKLLGIKSPPLVSYDYAFAALAKNRELIQLMNLGIANISKSGKLSDIREKYEDELSPRSFIFYFIAYALLIVVIIIISLIVLNYRKGIKTVSGHLANEASKRIQAEKKALYLRNYDPYTGLINRKNLKIKLARIIADNPDSYTCFIQISILDYFELFINAGESVCTEIEKHMAAIIKQNNVHAVGTMSPGKMGVIMRPHSNNSKLLGNCKNLFEAINTTISFDQFRFDIRCCAGIVIYPDHTNDVEQLFRHSYLAHAHALTTNNFYSIYSNELEPDQKSVRLLSDFKQSMIDDEFNLHYQPKLDLKNNKISGAEVLIRWNHHEFGFLPPISFIPLLEHTGLIKELTCYILAKAMERQESLSRSGIVLSINVSTKDLTDQNFVDTALNLKQHFNTALLLEITETAFTKDYNQFLKNVMVLKENGFKFSVDDYGTGYSSMQYLRDIKPYELKIDQSFIKNINNSVEDKILVASTVRMARELKTNVTAEGVEDMNIAKIIKNCDCDFAQGYGIAKPMDEVSFMEWLEKSSFSV